MKKSAFDPFLKAKENRKKLSNEHKKRFESGDEKALFDFLKIDRSNTQEPWVLQAIIEWFKNRDAEKMRKLTNVFKKPCYTDPIGPEHDELNRNLSLLALAREISRETGWSENKTIDALYDIYMCRYEETREETIKYAQEEYSAIPDNLSNAFLEMEILKIKGDKKPVSEAYFKDLLSKRLQKYSRIFPYFQHPIQS